MMKYIEGCPASGLDEGLYYVDVIVCSTEIEGCSRVNLFLATTKYPGE